MHICESYHGNTFRCIRRMIRQDCTRLTNLNLLVVGLMLAAFLAYQYQVCQISYRHPYLLQTLSPQSKLIHSWLSDTNKDVLIPGAPAFVVHYLWCRKGHFEFIHYLSVLSILKVLKPDLIVFHYTELPLTDSKGYVTWFEDIKRDIPFLMFKKIAHSRYCGHSFFENSDFDLADYNNPTGVFLTDDVAVLNFNRSDFMELVKSAKEKSRRVRAFLLPASEPYVVQESSVVQMLKCPPLQEFNKAGSNSINMYSCVQLTDRLSPSDIWHQNRPFYEFARTLIYGSTALPDPVVDNLSPVPSSCHILHFTKSIQFDVTAYASVLSALYVGKMQHVFVHSSQAPSGPLWEELMSKHKVSFVLVPNVNKWHPVLGDTLYGAYLLLRRGGVVVRSDTLWRKEIPRDLMSYTSVASVRRSVFRIINYSLDLSLLISKANSDFLKLLITTLRQTPKRHADAKSEEVAYRVYLETPQAVKLHTMLLQHVVCAGTLCQPKPEDMGAGSALAVQVHWTEGRPLTEVDLGRYRGVGIDVIKKAIEHRSFSKHSG